jgi:hypothetical protein
MLLLPRGKFRCYAFGTHRYFFSTAFSGGFSRCTIIEQNYLKSETDPTKTVLLCFNKYL